MASSSTFLLVVLAAVFYAANCQFGRERRPRQRSQTVAGCQSKAMDIFFILDSSTSIYVEDFKRERQFVRDVVSGFDVSQQSTRVGILCYSDELQQPPIGLSEHSTKGGVLGAITDRKLPYRTGVTNTHMAIQYVRENRDFRRDNTVTKAMVVVTDGGSRLQGATIREAQLAREAGFYVYVVGVGTYLDEDEWRAIANDPNENFIYNITNFRQLSEVTGYLTSHACTLTPGGRGQGTSQFGRRTPSPERRTPRPEQRRTPRPERRTRGPERRTRGPPVGERTACQAQVQSDLMFVAAPGATFSAVTIIDNIIERSSDRSNRLSISYFLDNCDDATNVRLGDIGDHCDRFALLDDSDNSGTLQRLMESLQQTARRNRANGANNQVAVLFIDDATMEDSDFRYKILDFARALKRDLIELVVVDLGVDQALANFVTAYASNRENVVTFRAGSIAGQLDAITSVLTKTCTAINKVDFTVNTN